MKLTGKTLRRSMSIVLAVMMLASLCAISFGTTASAAEATTYTYDFRNYTAYDYDEGGTNGHRTLSYAGAQDFNGTSKYWWDRSSGVTAYGALVGGAAVLNTGYGYSGNYGKISVRGDKGTALNNYGGQAMTVKEGYTYTVTATYVPISMTGYNNTVDVGICLIADDAVCSSRALNKVSHYSGDVARPHQHVSTIANVVRANQDGIDAIGSGVLLTEAIATAVSAKTISVTYTYDGSNSTDLGAHFGFMVGTAGAKLNCSADGDWKLSQVLVTDFVVTETALPTANFGDESVVVTDGKATAPALPAAEEGSVAAYWTTANGGVYFANEKVDATEGAEFTAHEMYAMEDNAASVVAANEYGEAGFRLKGAIAKEYVDGAEAVTVSIIPKLDAVGTIPTEWYKGGNYVMSIDVPNFTADGADGGCYEITETSYVYSIVMLGLKNDAAKAANFIMAIGVDWGEGAVDYYYVGCASYNGLAQ